MSAAPAVFASAGMAEASVGRPRSAGIGRLGTGPLSDPEGRLESGLVGDDSHVEQEQTDGSTHGGSRGGGAGGASPVPPPRAITRRSSYVPRWNRKIGTGPERQVPASRYSVEVAVVRRQIELSLRRRRFVLRPGVHKVVVCTTHGALPHRAPSPRCTAEVRAPCVAQVLIAWDILTALALAYTALLTPFEVGLLRATHSAPYPHRAPSLYYPSTSLSAHC